MKKWPVLLLALLLTMTVVYAEDYSTYTTEELLMILADVREEIDYRMNAERTYSPTEDFLYASNGTEVRINAYVGQGGDVVIPDEIDGVPVTQIGESAFENYDGPDITSIVLPKHLKEIAAGALRNRSVRGVVVLPPEMESIGSKAFCMSDISGVVIQSDCTLGSQAFSFCDECEFIYIREGSRVAFPWKIIVEGQDSLKIVVIPESVTEIHEGAFFDCPYMKIITPSGSYAEEYARANFIPCETESYDEYVAYYESLYPAA